jgi:hypothetical protein
MSKFSQINRIALSMAVGGVLGASVAQAAPVSLPQTINPGFGSTQWTITNTGGTDTGGAFTGGCDYTPGLTIEEAITPGGSGDAYDNAWQVWVDGSVFVPPATVDLTGTTLTAGPVSMSGLNVTVQYWFDTASGVGRTFVSLQNPTGAPISTSVQVPVNFGSDSNTVWEATSSGDTTMTTADTWAVTSQSSTSEIKTTVVPGTTSVTTTVFDCSGTQGIGSTYSVTIPAGETRSIMMFAGLGSTTSTTDSVAGAIAAAPLFDTIDSVVAQGWTSGLTAQQLSEVVNWGAVPPAPAAPTSIPTLSEWGMILLSSLLAVGTILTLRRQRK